MGFLPFTPRDSPTVFDLLWASFQDYSLTHWLPLPLLSTFCIVHWAGLPSAVMGSSILSKRVETGPTAAQLRLTYAQTMPRLPGVCLWQAALFQLSYGRQI